MHTSQYIEHMDCVPQLTKAWWICFNENERADMNMYEYSEYVYAYNVWMYITKYAYTVLEN